MAVAPATRAIGVRRILAVFIDACLFLAVWAAVGASGVDGSVLYSLAGFLALDIALTAYRGVSIGRLITGIKVARIGGGAPGLGRAALRTGLWH